MKNEPLGSFLDRLASRHPDPGGGSVAALAAALAAALLEMVCRLTRKASGHGHRHRRVESIRKYAAKRRSVLENLVEKDAAAYRKVLEAFRMPRNNARQRKSRTQKIQQGTRRAIEVPLETMRQAVEVMKGAVELARVGNPHALSDVVIAAWMGRAAVWSGRANVEINLPQLKSRRERKAYRRKSERLAAGAEKLFVLTLDV
jgi:formiminotetrahydrofolate cyclodeaminase